MKTPTEILLDAVSFAARAHRHQIRKDGQTPYSAHVFRVCLVLRHVFGIDDPKTLTAAVLHDTIEDTNTDFDDIADKFGEGVAGWVATLSKDKRLRDDIREPTYFQGLAAADWQVQAIKMADLYDNLTDLANMPASNRARSVRRAREFMEFFRPHVKPEVRAFFDVTDAKLNEVAAGL